MKLLYYEIYKILKRRVILIFMAVMLVLNIFLCYRSCIDKNEYTEEIKSVFEMYESNPEETILLANDVETAYDDMMKTVFEALKEHVEINTSSISGLYFDTLNKDHAVFGKLLDSIEYAQDFKDNIQKVIDTAKYNLTEFETLYKNKNSYIFQQQKKVIELYDKLKYMPVRPAYNVGWEKYYFYNTVIIFIFFAALIICSEAFATDGQCLRVIIHSTKKGRFQTVIAKIGAVFILNFISLLLFSVTNLIIIGMFYGFSDVTSGIQSVQSFMLCPVNLSILSYIILSFFTKFLIISAFSAILLFVSVYGNQIITYISGILFISLNYILSIIRYVDDNNVFKNLNFYSASNVNYLFTRYRSFNFFDNAVGYVPVTIILYSLIFIAFTATVLWLYLKKIKIDNISFKLYFPVKDLYIKFKDRIKKHVNQKLDGTVQKKYIKSIFGWEVYKVLISKRLIYFVAFLIIIYLFISYNENKPIVSYSNNAYLEFNEILHGEVTTEKEKWIKNERQRLNEIITDYSRIKEDYLTHKISTEDYMEAYDQYNIAVSRSAELSVIEERYNYLTGVKNTKNIDGWFLYDTGWQLLLFKDFDIILFACLLLLFGGLFSDEYSENKFVNILRSCKNGRGKLFNAKMLTVFSLTSALFVIFKGTELALIISNFGLPDAAAPLVSMPEFSNTNSDISIIYFTILHYAISYFSWLALAYVTAGLSSLFLRKTATISTISIVVLLPMFLSVFGFYGLDKLDLTKTLTGTGIYINSTEIKLFGNDFAYLGFYICIFLIVSCFSYILTFNKYK